MTYFTEGWYGGHNEDTGRWEELIQYPEWMDGKTSGCAHPDGVVLAGADNHNTGNHVVLLDVRTKQTALLPGKSRNVLIWNNNNNNNNIYEYEYEYKLFY